MPRIAGEIVQPYPEWVGTTVGERKDFPRFLVHQEVWDWRGVSYWDLYSLAHPPTWARSIMGRFKKTDQIFAYLNITLQDSNLLLFRDRVFQKKRNAIASMLQIYRLIKYVR